MNDVDKLLKAIEILSTSLTDETIEKCSTEELMKIEELIIQLKAMIDSKE